MNTLKWLKKNYYNDYPKIIAEFDLDIVEQYMKKMNYFPAILNEGTRKGSLALVRCYKEYDESGYEDAIQYSGWTGCFEYYILIKCLVSKETPSGYNHFWAGNSINVQRINKSKSEQKEESENEKRN